MDSSYKKLKKKRDETIFIIKMAIKEKTRIEKYHKEEKENGIKDNLGLENLECIILLENLIKELKELYEIE